MMGLAGSQAGSNGTTLEDDSVTQVLDTRDTIRRSLSLAGSEGIYFGILTNEHAAAGSIVGNVINPYAAGGNAFPGYPSPLPRGLDAYLIGSVCARAAGAGALDGAQLYMEFQAVTLAFNRNDDGTAGTAALGNMLLARWTGLDTSITGGIDPAVNDATRAYQSHNVRIKRGSRLRFDSDVSGAAADIECMMMLAILPTTLGQDVAT